MNNLFYQRLTELKDKQGKSYNRVEKEMGLPRNALHNYRWGKNPSADRLFQIADYFEVSPEYLMGKSDVLRKDYINIADFPSEQIFLELTDEQRKQIMKLCQEWALAQL